jgi:magnesium chelatase family protein
MAHEIHSCTLGGIDALAVRVQIDSNPGIHDFSIVGLPDNAVSESADRIGAAIKHAGFIAPRAKKRKFVVSLAPANLKKEGSGMDGAIAVAYLLESGQLRGPTDKTLIFGELGLDGRFTHTAGVLCAALLARDSGIKELIVPSENAQEASEVEGISVLGAADLASVTSHISGERLMGVTAAPIRKALENGSDSWAS